tara:strand:- start:3226 stop:4200 length:975 start_codon:yes stop_codon:yes gene_type:complete
MDKLFKLNYDEHPAYQHINIPWYEKAITRMNFFISGAISFFWLFGRKKYPLANNKDLDQEYLENEIRHFFCDGFMALKNVELAQSLDLKLKDQINFCKKKLEDVPFSQRTFEDCVTGFGRKSYPLLFKEIEEEIFSVNLLAKIILGFFSGIKPILVHFNIHMNHEDDELVFKHSKDDLFEDEMNFFHVDTNLNTIKIMIYLTDVRGPEHGAFEYVRGTQKLYGFKNFLKRRVIRKMGAFRRDDIGKRKLLALKSQYRMKNEFSDFSSKSPLGVMINERKKSVHDGSNLIIFDPLGIHRGGRVKKGKRLALQLVFCNNHSSWRIR